MQRRNRVWTWICFRKGVTKIVIVLRWLLPNCWTGLYDVSWHWPWSLEFSGFVQHRQHHSIKQKVWKEERGNEMLISKSFFFSSVLALKLVRLTTVWISFHIPVKIQRFLFPWECFLFKTRKEGSRSVCESWCLSADAFTFLLINLIIFFFVCMFLSVAGGSESEN